MSGGADRPSLDVCVCFMDLTDTHSCVLSQTHCGPNPGTLSLSIGVGSHADWYEREPPSLCG